MLLCIEDILKKDELNAEPANQGIKLEVSIFGIYKNNLFDLLSSQSEEVNSFILNVLLNL